MSFLFFAYAGIYDRFMKVFRFDDLEPILEHIEDVKGMNICDVGGGTGLLAHELVMRGNHVTIVDPCVRMTNIAQQRNSSIQIRTGTIEECLKNESYDCIILKDVLHHVKKQGRALQVCASTLRPGGYLIIQEFSPANIWTKCIFLFERFCLERIKPVSEKRLIVYGKKLGIIGKINNINARDYIYVGRRSEGCQN